MIFFCAKDGETGSVLHSRPALCLLVRDEVATFLPMFLTMAKVVHMRRPSQRFVGWMAITTWRSLRGGALGQRI